MTTDQTCPISGESLVRVGSGHSLQSDAGPVATSCGAIACVSRGVAGDPELLTSSTPADRLLIPATEALQVRDALIEEIGEHVRAPTCRVRSQPDQRTRHASREAAR